MIIDWKSSQPTTACLGPLKVDVPSLVYKLKHRHIFGVVHGWV